MRIKFTKNYDTFKANDVVPVDDAVGQHCITIGVAEKAADPNPLENLSEMIGTAVAKGLSQLKTEEKTQASKGPRIDPGESQDDRMKSLATQVKLITAAMCPQTYPGQQAEAREKLAKVYNSHFREFETKDLAEGSGTTGGYGVMPMYGTELFRLAAEKSIVRPLANVKNLPAREAFYPMLNQTLVPAGTQDSPQFASVAGVQMTWLGEAQPGTSTEPNFKQVHVKTNELQGLTKVSRFLLSDSFLELDAELRSLYSTAIAITEDYAYLQGNGNSKPQGVLNSPALLTYGSRENSNKFGLTDAANMLGALYPQSEETAVWLANNNLRPQLIQLKDTSGRVTYVNNVGTGYGDAKLMGGRLLLFGRPVFFTEKLPALGTAGDILLADFSKYIVANTGTLEIAASDQYAFNTNQITYRIIIRIDGRAQLDAPYTQQDGSTQTSPFVALHA